MNIDVREYLRINPISAHELTMSGDGKDCFLWFNEKLEAGSQSSDYVVKTQEQMFRSMFMSIFQGLVEEKDGNLQFKAEISMTPPAITWSADVHLTSTQFTRYVRRKDWANAGYPAWVSAKSSEIWEQFRDSFDATINDLEVEIDEKILELKRCGVLDYKGAVELQTKSMMRCRWDDPQPEGRPIYHGFGYVQDQIWCVGSGSDDSQPGANQVATGEMPTTHNHNPTMAETLTQNVSTNRGGGKLVGKFVLGNRNMVSQDNYSIPDGSPLGIIPYVSAIEDDGLTYPLYGQNVINWRTRKKTHNNVPPSTNIHIRVCEEPGERGISARSVVQPMDDETFKRYVVNLQAISAAEAQYSSYHVPQLDEYGKIDLTNHDCLLRLIPGDLTHEEVALMRQGVQMLLDIFAEDGRMRLGRAMLRDKNQLVNAWIHDPETGELVENLIKFISMSQILKPKLDEELVPIAEFMAWYNTKMEQMDRLVEKMDEVKELLVSIRPMNYVGRIIMSVEDDTEQKVIRHYGGRHWRRITNFLKGVDEDDPSLGDKCGEEYVCLRESNVPIHTHSLTLWRNDDNKIPEKLDKSNWMDKDRGGRETKVVSTAGSDSNQTPYAMEKRSLEYQISPLEYPAKQTPTIPHDNMPPYREVYIWECVESTEDERMVSGEPESQHIVTWLALEANPERQICYVRDGDAAPIPGTSFGREPERHGYNFKHWSRRKDDADGEEKIVDELPNVVEDTTCYAQWTPRNFTVKFWENKTPNDPDKTVETIPYGELVHNHAPSNISNPGKVLDGWWTTKTGGIAMSATTTVEGDSDWYAHWRTAAYRITLDGNRGEPASWLMPVEYGMSISSLPSVSRLGYTFLHWEDLDDELAEDQRKIDRFPYVYQKMKDSVWQAQWKANQYTVKFINGDANKFQDFEYDTPQELEKNQFQNNCTVTYVSNGGSCDTPTQTIEHEFMDWLDTRSNVKYQDKETVVNLTSQDGDVIELVAEWKSIYVTTPVPTRDNFSFLGWWSSPTAGVKLADGNAPFTSMVDITLHAQWKGIEYLLTLDPGNRADRPFLAAKWGDDSRSSKLVSVEYGKNYPAMPSTLDAPGYSFRHWLNITSGSTQVGGDGQFDLSSLVVGIDRNSTFVAQWTPTTYAIEYDMGPATTPVGAWTSYTIEDEDYTPPTPAQAAGYEFTGWSPEGIHQGSIGDVTFTALWNTLVYPIYYDLNEHGELPDGIRTEYTAADPDYTPPDLSEAGWKFIEWRGRHAGSDEEYQRKIPHGSTGAWEFIAQWQKAVHTVTFDPNGGALDPPETPAYVEREHGEQIGALPHATYDGYELAGWTTERNGNITIHADDIVTENITCYARWSVDTTARITYRDNIPVVLTYDDNQ